MIHEKWSASSHINDFMVMERLRNHYSQADVARITHISREYYTMIENGQVHCSVNMYHRIGAAFGTADWRRLIPNEYINGSFNKEGTRSLNKKTAKQN